MKYLITLLFLGLSTASALTIPGITITSAIYLCDKTPDNYHLKVIHNQIFSQEATRMGIDTNSRLFTKECKYPGDHIGNIQVVYHTDASPEEKNATIDSSTLSGSLGLGAMLSPYHFIAIVCHATHDNKMPLYCHETDNYENANAARNATQCAPKA